MVLSPAALVLLTLDVSPSPECGSVARQFWNFPCLPMLDSRDRLR